MNSNRRARFYYCVLYINAVIPLILFSEWFLLLNRLMDSRKSHASSVPCRLPLSISLWPLRPLLWGCAPLTTAHAHSPPGPPSPVTAGLLTPRSSHRLLPPFPLVRVGGAQAWSPTTPRPLRLIPCSVCIWGHVAPRGSAGTWFSLHCAEHMVS